MHLEDLFYTIMDSWEMLKGSLNYVIGQMKSMKAFKIAWDKSINSIFSQSKDVPDWTEWVETRARLRKKKEVWETITSKKKKEKIKKKALEGIEPSIPCLQDRCFNH